jgi:hypothetical protein
MTHAYYVRSGCVECLLKEARVVETIDKQARREIDEGRVAGSTALHLACSLVFGSRVETKKQILEMLLCAGANPTILNTHKETPLDTLRRNDRNNHTGIALLERAQFMVLLAKPRAINDANHAITKAKEDAQRKVLAAAPTFLQGRIREQQHLLLGPPAWSSCF